MRVIPTPSSVFSSSSSSSSSNSSRFIRRVIASSFLRARAFASRRLFLSVLVVFSRFENGLHPIAQVTTAHASVATTDKVNPVASSTTFSSFDEDDDDRRQPFHSRRFYSSHPRAGSEGEDALKVVSCRLLFEVLKIKDIWIIFLSRHKKLDDDPQQQQQQQLWDDKRAPQSVTRESSSSSSSCSTRTARVRT